MQNEQQRPMLSQDQKEHLFGCLLRIPSLFMRARDLLKAIDMDDPNDMVFVLLWQAALAVANRNQGSLPVIPEQARIQIELELKLTFEQNPVDVNSDHFNALFGTTEEPTSGLIEYIYAQLEAVFNEKEGVRLLKSYLEELTLYREVNKAVRKWTNGLPSSVEPFLNKIQAKRAAIAGLDQSAVMTVMPANYVPKVIETFTTGVAFLDNFMNGGQVLGEVYTILAPTGRGKTTLGVQIAVEGALHQQCKNPEKSWKDIGQWYFVTYESPVDPDIRLRAAAYHARISEVSLRANDYSSEKLRNWKPYERERWKDELSAKGTTKGERERFDAMRKQIGEANLHLIDYTGEVQGTGGGGVDEIVAMLENQKARGFKVAGVVIDYAGEAITRYVQSHTRLEPSAIFPMTAGFIDEVRIKIAGKFNCCVWVLHQLKGETSKKGPNIVFNHSEALNSRNFADNAWFAFTISNPDPQTNVTLVACTKQRRAAPKPAAIVKFEGEIRRMTAMDDKFALDAEQRRIVPAYFTGKIVPPKPPSGGFNRDPASDL